MKKTMRLLNLFRAKGRLLFALLIFLYCLLEVHPQDNNARLFLVISDETGQLDEPIIPPRYVSRSPGNVNDPEYKDCEIFDTNLGQSSDACLRTRSEYGVGVCERVFANFSTSTGSVAYEVMAVNTSDSGNDTFSSWDELCETLNGVEQNLLMFQRILDRSLVGVYSLSCENKSLCLAAYRQWLCVTRLPLFMATNTTSNLSSAEMIQDTDGNSYVRSKPCLSLCNQVAAQCPYFLPSSYQSDVPDELDNAIVYGGHAAFSCPTMTQVRNNSSYSLNSNCIGNGAASLQPSTAMNRLCTLLTILVCVIVGIILR